MYDNRGTVTHIVKNPTPAMTQLILPTTCLTRRVTKVPAQDVNTRLNASYTTFGLSCVLPLQKMVSPDLRGLWLLVMEPRGISGTTGPLEGCVGVKNVL
jgi:hypothetical protein